VSGSRSGFMSAPRCRRVPMMLCSWLITLRGSFWQQAHWSCDTEPCECLSVLCVDGACNAHQDWYCRYRMAVSRQHVG
jgi:hypothetical protein